jgi:2-dehydro-3-deoxyphosphogluconate aldolase/(4S)-4-hydroxy-2-oxoglutarate aldolase
MTADLQAAARGARFPVLPGVMTPSEIIVARQAGFDVLKLFPAVHAGGVDFLRALAGPFPDILFCPTGGITRDTAAEFLALPNVACVGGSWFTPEASVRQSDWHAIEALAREAAALR